jgi:hypothetical protein
MSVNVFRSKDNQERNYVTTRVPEKDVDKDHYEPIGELPWDFESEEVGRNDDPSRLGEYTEEELIKKIENFPGYAQSKHVLEKLETSHRLPTK